MNTAKGAPKRVLVVEDDALLAMLIEDTMRDAGSAEITLCTCTAEAMKALRNNDHDALILDVHLADRDDGWVIAELVQGLGAKAPHIVFSTGTPEDIPPGIARLGTILEKPYAPEDLVTATRTKVRRLLPRLIPSRR